MKLPILELRKISRINQKKDHSINLGKTKTFLHFFLLPNNNISSNLSGNKSKYEILSQNSYTQRYNNFNNMTKSKLIDLTKSRSELFNDLGTAYLKSCICKSSNRMTSNNIDSSDEETVQQNNYETYIKKSFNSFKIKKEISSFLYSSPDKQKRLITYLTQKFNKMKNNNINNEFEEKQMKKIKKKFFNLKDDDKKEKDESQNDDNNDDNNNDKDEDKTNLKEFSLFSLIMGKKNLKAQSRINHISNFKEKFAECWDNNILKNILPQNIKSKSYINLKSVESNKKYNENSSRSKNIKYYLPSKLKQFNLNSYNKKIINRYKYRHRSLFENDQQTKGLNDIYYLFNNKKLTRAESNF